MSGMKVVAESVPHVHAPLARVAQAAPPLAPLRPLAVHALPQGHRPAARGEHALLARRVRARHHAARQGKSSLLFYLL